MRSLDLVASHVARAKRAEAKALQNWQDAVSDFRTFGIVGPALEDFEDRANVAQIMWIGAIQNLLEEDEG